MKFYKLEDEIKFADKRYNLTNSIMNSIAQNGYSYIEPAMFEKYDSFVDENKRVDHNSTVKVLSNDGGVSILTADLTSGIVSDILEKSDKETKVKLFYYGKIFKNTDNGIKEIRKLGAEYLGEDDISSDLEILNMAISVLNNTKLEYVLEIGASSFLKNILKSLGLSSESYTEIMEIIYKKDSYKLSKYLTQFENKETVNILNTILNVSGDYDEIKKALIHSGADAQLLSTLSSLENIKEYIFEKKEFQNTIYDLSLVSELDYYTGIIFRAYVKGSNEAILRGGRYRASSECLQKEISAVGFSVEIDRLTKLM